MSFDPVTSCGGSSLTAGSAVLVILWFFPTVLLALQHCQPAGSSSRALRLWLGTSVSLSTSLSTIWLGIMPEIIAMSLLVVAVTAATCFAVLGLYRSRLMGSTPFHPTPKYLVNLKSLVAVPVVLSALVAGIGAIYTDRHLRFLRSVGFDAARVSEFRRQEVIRWAAVTVATLLLVTTTGVFYLSRRHAALKGAALAGMMMFSVGAAYLPERDLISKGWIVHPPRIAVLTPAASGFLSMAIFSWLRRLRDEQQLTGA